MCIVTCPILVSKNLKQICKTVSLGGNCSLLKGFGASCKYLLYGSSFSGLNALPQMPKMPQMPNAMWLLLLRNVSEIPHTMTQCICRSACISSRVFATHPDQHDGKFSLSPHDPQLLTHPHSSSLAQPASRAVCS